MAFNHFFAENPTRDPRLPAHRQHSVFVYGTLKPGHCRWSLIAPFALSQRESSVTGSLFDTGMNYPAAVFGSGGEIHGHVVVLADRAANGALATLDAVEGDEYERLAVCTIDGETCWSYAWKLEVDGLVRLDDGLWRGD